MTVAEGVCVKIYISCPQLMVPRTQTGKVTNCMDVDVTGGMEVLIVPKVNKHISLRGFLFVFD